MTLKSIDYNQQDIINNILKLHNEGNAIDCDITYSKGVFYKRGKVKEPVFKFDKYPQTEDTLNLEEFYQMSDFQCIMCDLPFVISKGKSLEEDKQGSNIISKRFNCYNNPKELFDSYRNTIKDCYDRLKEGGILIFKCQDTVSGGKNYFIHNFAFNEALKVGFYPKDLVILLAKQRLISSKVKNQQHFRKYHSYFWVFKKEKCKINYK